MRTSVKRYLKENNIETNNCLVRSSRLYEDGPPGNWWFKFDESDLDSYQYFLFCGALGTANKEFVLLRVPTEYLLKNKEKIDVGKNGWTLLYISKDRYCDLRSDDRLKFSQFLEN